VPVTGLKTPFRDGYVRDLAEDVLQLAKVIICFLLLISFPEAHLHAAHDNDHIVVMQNGLERRGYKEVGFLREVDEVVRTGDAFSTLLFIRSREKLT
jgi:glutamate--cysteine ligase